MLHFSVLLQLEGWWLQKLPCIIANAFNRGWEQFLVQIAHGSYHPAQLQHIPPSPSCLLLRWEGCFLRGLGMAKGWSDLLKNSGMLPPLCVQPFLCTTPRLPLPWGWSRVGAPAKSSHPAAPQPTHSTPCAQGLPREGMTSTHFAPYAQQRHGWPLPLCPLHQLRPTHRQMPHLCVPL